MVAAAFSRGCKGDLVGVLQRGLASSGHYTGMVDNDFGGATTLAVSALQKQQRFPVTGRANAKTWTAATQLDFPELFQRCLQLTARFEGHGYGTVTGNWDNAWLTWGIIGFTLKHREIQLIVQEASQQDPALLTSAFKDQAAIFLALCQRNNDAELLAWAESVSVAATGKRSVIEPWRGAFRTFGSFPQVQALQRQHARQRYFEPAQRTAQRLQLSGDRGVALAFDIHVQNGGVKTSDEDRYRQLVARLPVKGRNQAQREVLARLVAQSSRFPADVSSRKLTIAQGTGLVHQESFDLNAWALAGQGA
jgi:hypothetical protein